jgi:hypothetical protein
MRLQSLLALLIYSASLLPKPVFSQWYTGCNLRRVSGREVLSITRLASVGYHNNMFIYAIAETKKGNIPVIFRQQHTPCWLIFSDLSGGSASLSEGVPIPVANFFARMLLKRQISKAGLQTVQNSINTKNKMYAEEVDAAKTLGLSVPSNIKVIPYSTKPPIQTKTDLQEERI